MYPIIKTNNKSVFRYKQITWCVSVMDFYAYASPI